MLYFNRYIVFNRENVSKYTIFEDEKSLTL